MPASKYRIYSNTTRVRLAGANGETLAEVSIEEAARRILAGPGLVKDLERIRMRALHHLDDTDADSRRYLDHVESIATSALKAAAANPEGGTP